METALAAQNLQETVQGTTATCLSLQVAQMEQASDAQHGMHVRRDLPLTALTSQDAQIRGIESVTQAPQYVLAREVNMKPVDVPVEIVPVRRRTTMNDMPMESRATRSTRGRATIGGSAAAAYVRSCSMAGDSASSPGRRIGSPASITGSRRNCGSAIIRAGSTGANVRSIDQMDSMRSGMQRRRGEQALVRTLPPVLPTQRAHQPQPTRQQLSSVPLVVEPLISNISPTQPQGSFVPQYIAPQPIPTPQVQPAPQVSSIPQAQPQLSNVMPIQSPMPPLSNAAPHLNVQPQIAMELQPHTQSQQPQLSHVQHLPPAPQFTQAQPPVAPTSPYMATMPTAIPAPQPVICPNFLDLSGVAGPCNQMQLGSLSLEPSSLLQPPQALTAPQSLHIEGLKVELPPLSVLPNIGSLNLEQPNNTPFSVQGFVGDPMLVLQPPNPMQFAGVGSFAGEAPPMAQNAIPNFALGQFDMSFVPGCTSFGSGVQNAGIVSPIPWC